MSRPVARCLGGRGSIALALASLLGLTLACGGGEEPAATAERVENAALEVAIDALPSGFVVARNEGPALVLDAADADGQIVVEVGAQVGGVNLIDELNQHVADIEARPGGTYQGQVEFVGPLGPLYLSRGRFTDDAGAAMEEYRAMTLHPRGDRALHLIYTYPAGDDTAERGNALAELAGELGPLAP